MLFQLGVEHMAYPLAGLGGTLALFALAVGLFCFYGVRAKGRSNAALDLSLFSNRAFSVGVIAGGIGRVGLNSSAFLLPLMLQIGFGMTPILSALITSLAAVGAFVAKPILKRAIGAFGYGRLIVAVTLAGSALMASFSMITPDTALAVIIVTVLTMGAMRTMHFNAVNSLTYSEVPDDKLSSSVASAGVFQQLSMGLGISLGATALAFLVPKA